MAIRPPAVAGLFYPAQASRLRADVDALLDAAVGPALPPKALIAPHAGYIYSGSTAACAYASLRSRQGEIAHVVLLGPCHRVSLPGIALPKATRFATPLGETPVWAEGAARAARLPAVVTSAEAHAEEHSLEVQLPFIQRVLGAVDVLPLAVGWADASLVAAVLASVWGGAETVVIVSSDLSHYLPYADARRRDGETIRQILALAGPLAFDQACGAAPVNGLLLAGSAHGLRPRLFKACNSGDTAGDKNRVVGYAAIGFYNGPDSENNGNGLNDASTDNHDFANWGGLDDNDSHDNAV
ncbi:MAG: AmmeMemoRadiSam system protein B [Propionibacteriaceae bacterium]|jgi:AmmeMemoRadiSam system protein B|nr:AmmeMemoRadiSam system protein B [Propionibacteriaceae bacterium]